MRRAELGAGEWYSNCDMCQLEEGGRGGGGVELKRTCRL